MRIGRWVIAVLWVLIFSLASATALPADHANLLPNGGFEYWNRYASEILAARSSSEGRDAEPRLPVRWTVEGAVAPSDAARDGTHALAVSRRARLQMGPLEVAGGAVYSFGVHARGVGHVRVRLTGAAPEGSQTLAEADGPAGEDWVAVGSTLTLPRHIHRATLTIEADSTGDLLLDDAWLGAALAAPYDPDAPRTAPRPADEHTLLRVDFETEPDGFRTEGPDGSVAFVEGRFGRGLRVTAPGFAEMPLILPEPPPEGTIEFWFAPDAMPQLEGERGRPQQAVIELASAARELAEFVLSNFARWTWITDTSRRGSPVGVQAAGTFLERMRADQWTHVAVVWDPQSVQLYLDGVLAAERSDAPPPWPEAPVLLRVGSTYGNRIWSGRIDEIHVSAVRRYGLQRPVDAPEPEAVATPPAPVKPPVVDRTPALSVREVAEARRQQVTPLPPDRGAVHETRPDAAGRFVYEAAAARPLVEDLRYERDPGTTLPGVETLSFPRRVYFGDPEDQGVYWTVGDLPPGEYRIGVLLQVGTAERDSTGRRDLGLYLNGRVVQADRFSDPVQAAPDLWFAELLSAQPERLRAGDEIALVALGGARVARLYLHTRVPAISAHRHGLNFGGHWFEPPAALSVTVEPRFLAAEGQAWRAPHHPFLFEQELAGPDAIRRDAEGRGRVACRIANPLPVSVTVDFEAVVRGHYRRTVGRLRERLTIPPHAALERLVPFEVLDGEPAYGVAATLTPVEAPDLGWPDADALDLLPGLRQSIPWPDPFADRGRIRLIFTHTPDHGARGALSLNGVWELAPTVELEPPMPPPEDLSFNRQVVPFRSLSVDRFDPRANGLYVRRTFDLTPEQAGGAVLLHLQSVNDEATVYVNGVRTGNVRGHWTPLTADLTDHVRSGENEVVIVVRGLLAIMNPDYVNPLNPVPSIRYLDAPGNFGGRRSWWLGEVSLEFLPRVAAESVRIIPSVRQGRLIVKTRIVNRTREAQRIRIEPVVYDDRDLALSFPPRELALAAGESVEPRFEADWPDGRRWSPADPHLHTLAVSVAPDAPADTLRERFGFRESWIEGNRILLNGTPIKLKGFNGSPFSGAIRNADLLLDRQSRYPDFMDEFGYLTMGHIGGLQNTASRHNAERDVFWEAVEHNAKEGIRRLGRHPSIILWTPSNEWLGFLSSQGGDYRQGARRFKTLSDALRAFDPSRWTLFHGDGDLDGMHDNYSGHYMLEGSRPHPIGGFGFNGHSVYFPDGAFWRLLDRWFEPGESVSLSAYRPKLFTIDSRVIMNNENQWKAGAYLAPGPAKFAGEEAVLSSHVDHGSGPVMWMWKQNVDAHRDLGCSSVSSYGTIPGYLYRAYVLQSFLLPDLAHHGFSGDLVRRLYSLHNDRFGPDAELTFRWRLRHPDGRVVREEVLTRDMPSGGIERGEMVFDLPPVEARTVFTLELQVESEGRMTYREDRDLAVWPAGWTPSVGRPARQVHLFDPAGSSADALTRAGVEWTPLATLTPPPGEPASSVVIVGEEALSAEGAPRLRALRSYIERGGRVLVLAQKTGADDLPARTTFEIRERISMPFVRIGEHPVLEGLTSWDLHFWMPDRASAIGAYAKPSEGPALPLVDSGNSQGLEWTPLLELYRGEGRYLLCQFPVAARYEVEPMARELLARLVRYTAGETVFRPAAGAFQTLLPTGHPIADRLEQHGTAHAPAAPDAPLDPRRPVLVAGLGNLEPETVEALRRHLAAGGTVVAGDARPEDAETLGQLAGAPARVTVPAPASWTGRGFRRTDADLVSGITHLDLYWKTYPTDYRQSGTQFSDPALAIEPLQHFAVAIEDAAERVYPGALIERAVGPGRLIVDQRRWWTGHPDLQTRATRQLTALALGLGVSVAPFEPPRELPARVNYRTLDLRPFANRALHDEVSDDGQGGWTDQGPVADLRTFETGRRRLLGVPFDIGEEPRSCIVLASERRVGADHMPDAVTLPLGFPVEGLFFLHASAYSGVGHVGRYEIVYADGGTERIELHNGVNIRDWVDPQPGAFTRERGTVSRVAWTGSTPAFARVSLYQMRWVNLRPDVPVEAVVFSNPLRQAVPILLGLTAAQTAETGETAADPEVARRHERIAAAAALEDADEAVRQLEALLARAPGAEDAHHALLDRIEQTHDEDRVLAVCLRWIEAGATHPTPFNRAAEILERKGDLPRAFELLGRSLEVEWNQPDTILDHGRLQRALGEEAE